MEDEQITAAYMDILMQKRDPQLNAAMEQMESTDNLNNRPLMVRGAGMRAARRAFYLGVKWAQEQAKA